MNLVDKFDRARAAEALRRVVGGDREYFYNIRLPASMLLPAARLILAAGDPEQPLDPFDLEPIAVREDKDIMAIWVDRALAGHALLIDVVLTRDGRSDQFCAYRLWMGRAGDRFLVPAQDVGPWIEIGARGLRLIPARPWRDKIERLEGITTGQAFVHQIVWAGTSYETPVNRNLER